MRSNYHKSNFSAADLELIRSRAPKIGDEVSYAFNGDYYYAGRVTKISPTGRITAQKDNGSVHLFTPTVWTDLLWSDEAMASVPTLCVGWEDKGWNMVPGRVERLSREF